jgi:hypothetical protein
MPRFTTRIVARLFARSSAALRHCVRFAPRYFALALVAITLALANLPGARSYQGYCRHGWPCTFLWRRVLGTTDRSGDYLSTGNLAMPQEGYVIRWISPWLLWSDVRRFEVAALLADVAIAAAILAIVAGVTRNWYWKRFQYRLRDLFLVMFSASLVISAIAWAVRQHHSAEQWADCLRKKGVALSFGNPKTEWLTDATELTLPGFTMRATGLLLEECVAGDAELLILRQLPGILDLVASPSTTDVGLREIGCLAELQRLHLRRSRITDAGLAHIKALRSLEELDLGNTNVTDRGLACLEGLPCLFILCLDGTKVTGRGLVHVGRLSELEWLCLDQTSVDDEGLKSLVDLPCLNGLELHGTPVSDAGLETLGRLKNLKHLDLRGTRVTKSGVSRLRSLLGNTTILYEETENGDQKKPTVARELEIICHF